MIKGRDPSSLKTSRRNQIEPSGNQTPTETIPLQTRTRKSITIISHQDHHHKLIKETQTERGSRSINREEPKLQKPIDKTLEEEMERRRRRQKRGSRSLNHQRTTLSDQPNLRSRSIIAHKILPSHVKVKQQER